MKIIQYLIISILSVSFFLSCSTDSGSLYQLNVSSDPVEAGSVSPAEGEYDEGSEVNVSATPNDGWMFERWQGSVTGTDNPISVTMDSDKNITALFAERQFPLETETDGEGTVEESLVQSKITDYDSGAIVELNAVPAGGWKFVEWQGDLTGSDNPQTITMDGPKSVTAVFEEGVSEPNPLSVNFETENSSSVTTLIPREGGSISTTDSRGITYTLDIPENALLSPEEITMTPFSSIEDAPVGSSFRLGVDLQPEGLEFLEAATLRIEDPNGLPGSNSSQIVAFGAESNGDEFYFSSVRETTSNEVVMPVSHFSGNGSMEATDDEIRDQQQNHPPTDPRDRASQNLLNDPSIQTEVSILEAYHAQAMAIISVAGSSPELMEQAFQLYRFWKIKLNTARSEVQAQVSALDAQLISAMISTFQTAVVQAKTDCLNHDLSKIRLLLRWSYLSLIYPEVVTGSTSQSLLEDAANCGQFELEIESSMEFKDGDPDDKVYAAIKGVIPIGAEVSTAVGITFSGQGNVEHTGLSWIDSDSDDCITLFTGKNGDMTITGLNLGLNIATAGANGAPSGVVLPVNFRITMVPGNIREQLQIECDGEIISDEETGVWFSGWADLHIDQMTERGFEMKEWIPPSSTADPALIAVKVNDLENDIHIEQSEFKLFHRPAF
ncbi:MAG: hypothetical protein U5K72_17990 [Balneolaceae bacterium]|nr:hypothetical protein [Balneolaceae bacterium]